MDKAMGWLGLVLAAAGWSATAQAAPGRNGALPAGSRYVALGSSFASGPGITTPADMPPDRCGRSSDNYAHQLARLRRFDLVDVTCSGATTANILGRWAEIPPQIDAVTAATRLVTITIGGNDVGYLGGLIAASCAAAGIVPVDGRPAPGCTRQPPLAEEGWSALEGRMATIVGEIRRRAPSARIVFVQYQTVLPRRGTCAATPLSPADAAAGRAVARRLAALTVRVARRRHALVLAADRLSRGHDACAAAPWVAGFGRGYGASATVPYHPDLAGMTALAHGLDALLD